MARTMTEVQDMVGPMTGIGTGLLRAVATLVTALITVILLALSPFFARQLNVNAQDV